jgi:scyllo-inositol 2-dehydrogenase (NADP+)
VLLILSGENRPLIQLEISSCCRYPTHTYNVYGKRGGLKGNTSRLEWEYYDPQAAPELKLITTPLNRPNGTPAYCSDSLTWHKGEWAPEGIGLFESMSGAFYSMLYRVFTANQPLEITPQQVRQQIAVIEECQRQNPHIYGGH